MRDIANSLREFRSFHPPSNCILYRKWRLKKITKVTQGISNSINALKQVLISEILWKKESGKPFGSSWHFSGKRLLSCSAGTQPCADSARTSAFHTELPRALPRIPALRCCHLLLSPLLSPVGTTSKKGWFATPAKHNWKYFMLLIPQAGREEHYQPAAFISPRWGEIRTQHWPGRELQAAPGHSPPLSGSTAVLRASLQPPGLKLHLKGRAMPFLLLPLLS